MSTTEDVKVTGYRELTREEKLLMNEIKVKAVEIGKLCDRLVSVPGVDQRSLALGKTNLQQGFMWVVRSVARPETF